MLDEIVSEFLVESYESLDQLDRDLMALEESPGDRNRIASIFRTIHTIKGTSGFLAFPKLERVTHVGESLLVALRDGSLTLTNDITNALLAMVDAVRSILNSIESNGSEGEDAYQALTATMERLRSGDSAPQPKPANNKAEIPVEEVVQHLTASAPQASGGEVSESSKPTTVAPKKERRKRSTATSKKSARNSTKSPAEYENGEPEEPQAVTPVPCTSTASSIAASGDTKPTDIAEATGTADNLHHAEDEICENSPVASAMATKNTGADSKNATANGSVAESSVRIDVTLLDRLMNLVGELVLARNQVMQCSQKSDDLVLAAASQRMNLITTELQQGVMKTRMQPIKNAWNKLPRVVRDLAQTCGKQVCVQMEGADTELDKTILEAIKDPLTHIVRNSVDHGIETAQDRVAAGKTAEGTLLLRAYHEGGQVIIEIADDGGGINVTRVRDKAIEKGLVTRDQAQAMTDREAVQLILLPGFSTAVAVTKVSGRGVGMDVVKTNVEKIGGSLDIHSITGRGTTLRIRIPLTLAIVPALIVRCQGDRYCIPQISLQELVRLDTDRVRNEIEILHSVPVHRLRGRLLPLIYLDEELGLRARRTTEERYSEGPVNIVVLQAEDRQFGLVVDRISDTQEIVVKPLGQHLKNLSLYSGSTIMGDGAVALILDVTGIAQQGNILSHHAGRQFMDSQSQSHDESRVMESYLIVDPNDGTRVAIPLSMVSRLEEINADDVEHLGHRHVVQYRGEIMPLMSLSGHGMLNSDSGKISLVVYSNETRRVGIVVGKIIDIVDHHGDVQDANPTQIIAGRVTRMVDLGEFIGMPE